MDPRERADALLARARARGSFVVTPEDAISPMDAASTLQIPRSMIAQAVAEEDPDATLVVPAPLTRPMGEDRTRSGRPPVQPDYGHTQPLPYPEQYQAQQPAEPVREEQEGIIPTTTVVNRRTLAQRLDGE